MPLVTPLLSSAGRLSSFFGTIFNRSQLSPPSASAAAYEPQRRPENKSVGALAEQMREDYQFTFAESTILGYIKSVDVGFSLSGQTDERSDQVIEAIKETWDNSLHKMDRLIGDGRVAFEIVWGFEAPLNVIDRLEHLPYEKTELKLTKQGVFRGVKLTGVNKILPPTRSWWAAIGANVLEPHGRSMFLGAPYQEWLRRRELLGKWNCYWRKQVFRGGIAYGPATFRDPDNPTKTIAADKIFPKQFEKYQSGDWMYLDGTMMPGTNKRMTEFVPNPEPLPPEHFDGALSKSDIRVSRALRASELAIQSVDGAGAMALGVIHRLGMMSVIEGLVSELADCFVRHPGALYLFYNYGANARVKLKKQIPDLTNIPDSLLADIAKLIVTSSSLGPLVEVLDIVQVLEGMGVPLAENARSKLQDLIDDEKKRKELEGQRTEKEIENLGRAADEMVSSVEESGREKASSNFQSNLRNKTVSKSDE